MVEDKEISRRVFSIKEKILDKLRKGESEGLDDLVNEHDRLMKQHLKKREEDCKGTI